MKKKVLIIGLFPDVERNPVTQAHELAKVLKENGYQVLTVSKYRNKVIRLLHIISYILLNKNKFDVSIVQFFSGNSIIWQYVACYLTKWLNKKLIITMRGGSLPEKIKKYPVLYMRLINKADKITCPSQFMVEELVQYEITSELVENSIPLDKYPFYNKKIISPVLLWMRAFSDIYNPEMAVRTVKELKKYYPDVKLYMGGPDLGSLANVKELISSEGLDKNVEIVGFMNLSKKKYYAEKASIFISTNRVDNAPVTFIEMWAMGLPIISTNIGGIPYMARDNETALLVNDNDHIAMSEKIKDLLVSAELSRNLILNGHIASGNYREKVVFNKWDRLLSNN